MGYNIGMVSLGCAKNATDSETMLGLLSGRGHKIVSDPAQADVIIVNTCGFIESAKQESIDTLLEMARYKEGRCRLLIAAGCMAERYNTEVLDSMPEVDAVVGTGDYDRIADVINSALIGERPALYGHKDRTPEEGLPRVLSTPDYTAYVKIADGCDNNCTYCAIPKIRGRFRSRHIEDIYDECVLLADRGVKEIILIAQDTTRYGSDIYGKYALDTLIEKLCTIEKLHWIRVHYFYPEAITDGLIRVMAENEKVCSYVDMPVQHGNDDILRRMARRTTRSQMEEKIAKLRAAMPDCVIRTSIIVGFPGETEEQFGELCDFVRTARFDRMGVFCYSQEEDTAAAEFDGQLDEETKRRRRDILMTIQQQISLENNRSKAGSVIEVLTEGYDEDNFMYYGRSRGDSIGVDSRVYFAAHHDVKNGEFVNVRILDADEYDLTGEEFDNEYSE